MNRLSQLQVKGITQPYRMENKDIINIFLLFIMSRFLFFVILYVVGATSGIQYEQGSVYLQYDGQHYYNIATNGYTNGYEYAFFPLFPLLIRGFSLIGVAIPGTIVLNHILTLLTAYLLYLTGSRVMKKSDEECLSMSRLWIFSPISIATCILYSEALFVFLTVFTYYLYKRNRYYGAGLMLGLSIATRSLGSLLFFSIFLVMVFNICKKKDWKSIPNILKLFIPATLISVLYPLFLYFQTGNWHYFLDIQFIYWGRVRTNIIEVLANDFMNIGQINALFVFTYLALAICIYVLYKAIKTKEDTVLILYLTFSIIMIFSTSREIDAVATASFYRYLFGCSAVYLLISKNLKLKPITIVSTVMGIFATVLFCGGSFLI